MATDHLTAEDIRETIFDNMDEMGFDYKGKPYFISCLCAPKGQVFIGGPDNEECVPKDMDAILDTLLVDGKPLRVMLDKIV